MPVFDTEDKTVYEAMKSIFSFLGLDKELDEATFKRLSGKYKDYIIQEARAWKAE